MVQDFRDVYHYYLLFSLLIVTRSNLLPNPSAVRSNLQNGKPIILNNWLPHNEVTILRDLVEVVDTQGYFIPSGLRVSPGEDNQMSYGNEDRRICDEIPSEYYDHHLMAFSERMDQVCIELSELLGSKSMGNDDENVDHESYISISNDGASLNEHIDERHEELKPSQRYNFPSRRSISWLVYLNDDTWKLGLHGGQLRFFIPKQELQQLSGTCGSNLNNGDLQVGWLLSDDSNYGRLPVYMRSLRQSNDNRIRSQLYIFEGGEEIFITKSFKIQHDSQHCTFYTDVLRNLLVSKTYKRTFIPLERIHGSTDQFFTAVDVEVMGGTLVLFDSVTIPHLVLPTINSRRIAIAGWFHEALVPLSDIKI
jgi:Rps23 Pro-64 3,4-dihydroxylase Tpa1-like proline 4-hydroxylase